MATGMITRHFDHPSGATATLEMPAGWSRNCYFVLTMDAASTEDGRRLAMPERVTCATPDEARQRAIERERQALANGWRPRTVAAKTATTETGCDIHLATGEKLPLAVWNIEERVEVDDELSGFTALRAKRTILYINAILRDIPPSAARLETATRILIRQRWGATEKLRAAVVAELTLSEWASEPTVGLSITAICTTFEGDEQNAIARWSDREQVILDLIDDPNPSVSHLWQEISKRVQEPSDRAQVQQEILRRRAERQAAEAREIEQQASRERQEALEAVRAMQAASRPPASPRRQQPLLVAQEDTEAAMRRLSGGQDFKPKRRKIDLGE